MSPEEQETAHMLMHVIRCARKGANYNQVTMAEVMGVSQSFISKIESGNLMMSAYHWMKFCDITNIDPQSLKFGHIDALKVAKVKKQLDQQTQFRVPSKYINDSSIKVRFIWPFIEYVRKKLGDDATEVFFKKHFKTDYDFLFNLDHQVNRLFFYDLIDKLKENKLITGNEFGEVEKVLAQRPVYGAVYERLFTKKADTGLDLVKNYLKNYRMYDSTYICNIIKETEDVIEVDFVPSAYFEDEYKLGSAQKFEDFFQIYQQAFLSGLIKASGDNLKVTGLDKTQHFAFAVCR
jgi:DNA-binding XRE family transcriptional regulator